MSQREALLPLGHDRGDDPCTNIQGQHTDSRQNRGDGRHALSDINSQRSVMASSQPQNAAIRSIFFGSVANLCSATLGAGILALPFAFYQAGLVFGSLLLLISAWATCASIQLLVHVCHTHSIATYEQVVEHVLGRPTRKIVEWSILIFSIGCAVAYIIAVGDIVQQILTFPMSKSAKHWFMIAVWCLAMFPLSSLRRMQSLQCASTVGITSITILLIAATAHLLQGNVDSHSEGAHSSHSFAFGGDGTEKHGSFQSLRHYLWPADNSWQSVLRACPIVFFAFSCQVNVCQIYDELPNVTPSLSSSSSVQHADSLDDVEEGNDRNVARSKQHIMNMVAATAVTMCGLLYSSISLVTLIDFGDAVLPNILSCYAAKTAGPLMHIAFVAMALAVVMAYPLNIFPARVSIIHMIHSSKIRQRSGNSICGSAGNNDDEECRTPMLSHRRSSDGSDDDDDEVGNNPAAAATTQYGGSHSDGMILSSPLSALHHRHVPLTHSDRGISMVTAANSSMASQDENDSLGDNDEQRLLNQQPSGDPLMSAAVDQQQQQHLHLHRPLIDDPVMISMPEEDVSYREHMLITLGLSGLTLLLALVLPNISVVFGLLGGTTSSLLGFVVPGLLGIYGDNGNRGAGKLRCCDKISAWILVVAGAVVGVLTTGVTVYGTIQDLM